MSDCISIDTQLFGDRTGPTGPTGPLVLTPTADGQIPVAERDTVSGVFQYAPKANPLSGLTAADDGRALIVDASNPQQIAYRTELVVKQDDALTSTVGSKGVIGYPELTVTAPNILNIPPLKAVFGFGNIVSAPLTALTITKSGTLVATDDFTYVSLTPQGQYIQSPTPPTGQAAVDNILIAEVFHANGGPITTIRPYFPYQSAAETARAVARAVNLVDRGFAFTRNAANGAVNQAGPSARLLGLNIVPSGEDRSIRPFPAGTITVEYFSFNPADRVAALTNFNRTYRLDTPATNTSVSLPNFGIVVLFAGSNGSYIALAPQRNFLSLNDALDARTTYAASVVTPDDFLRLYVAVATIIVSPIVTPAGTTFDIASIGDAAVVGGSVVGGVGSALPSPSTGQAGDAVVVNPTTSAYVLADTPDLSAVPAGNYLKAQAGQIVPVTPVATGIDAMLQASRIRFVVIQVANGAVTGTSGDVTPFNIAGFVPLAVDGGSFSFSLPVPTSSNIGYTYCSVVGMADAVSTFMPVNPLSAGKFYGPKFNTGVPANYTITIIYYLP